MPGRQTLAEIVAERYHDPEIQQAVLESIAEHQTEAKILSGELVLPTVKDAQHWHKRITGKTPRTETEREQGDLIADLQRRLSALEAEKAPPQQQATKGGA